jgi:hypothetical protein
LLHNTRLSSGFGVAPELLAELALLETVPEVLPEVLVTLPEVLVEPVELPEAPEDEAVLVELPLDMSPELPDEPVLPEVLVDLWVSFGSGVNNVPPSVELHAARTRRVIPVLSSRGAFAYIEDPCLVKNGSSQQSLGLTGADVATDVGERRIWLTEFIGCALALFARIAELFTIAAVASADRSQRPVVVLHATGLTRSAIISVVAIEPNGWVAPLLLALLAGTGANPIIHEKGVSGARTQRRAADLTLTAIAFHAIATAENALVRSGDRARCPRSA